jgi:hypothetical protein
MYAEYSRCPTLCLTNGRLVLLGGGPLFFASLTSMVLERYRDGDSIMSGSHGK